MSNTRFWNAIVTKYNVLVCDFVYKTVTVIVYAIAFLYARGPATSNEGFVDLTIAVVVYTIACFRFWYDFSDAELLPAVFCTG
jgi:hypothetical protein